MKSASTERAEIIRFWRTVEMFSPPKVDKVSRERRVFAVKPDQPLLWEPEHELAQTRLRKDETWRHVVYVEIYSLQKVFEVLSRVFEPDADSYDERPSSESALAAFIVSGEGRSLNRLRSAIQLRLGDGPRIAPWPGNTWVAFRIHWEPQRIQRRL